MQYGPRYQHPPRREITVVTGTTGRVGLQIAHDLAIRGYDVVIAARDATRGEVLTKEIQVLSYEELGDQRCRSRVSPNPWLIGL